MTVLPPPTIGAPTAPISPWQILYAGAHAWRRTWYRERSHRLPLPIVSVGNLHWGGSGKTPLVASIARHLTEGGLHVVVLSRGYRGRARGCRIVSIGEDPLGTVDDIGDEPAMLAQTLRGIPIVVGSDRHAAGILALSELDPRPDMALLDDGFSHLGLARDLDILTFPSTDPFAGGRLFPGGRLREPLASAAHAQAAILTGVDETDVDPSLGAQLARSLRPFGFTGEGFVSSLRARTRPRIEASDPVLLVTGIARPERALRTAQRLGLDVRRHLRFGDHHMYRERSLRRIREAFQATRARFVLTTSKDLQKLEGRVELPIVELRIEALPETSFWRWLTQSTPISKSGAPLSTD